MALSSWFEEPQGRDRPQNTKRAIKKHDCVIGFEDSTFVHGYCKLHPDSQSPRIELSVTRKLTREENSPSIVIGLQNCIFEYGMETGQMRIERIDRLRKE
ncbi:hypothetical protein DPV78_006465 [Talaromyces pinophilus]|nr:hypothetical protein DPV78_006465 [Talaromyces pinophilus]